MKASKKSLVRGHRGFLCDPRATTMVRFGVGWQLTCLSSMAELEQALSTPSAP